MAGADGGQVSAGAEISLGDRIQSTALACLERLVEATYSRGREPLLGEYMSFTARDPKPSNISAAPFLDRVVQHALWAVVEPILGCHTLENRARTDCAGDSKLGDIVGLSIAKPNEYRFPGRQTRLRFLRP